MGLFGNPRNNVNKWAPVVMEGYVPGMPIDEEVLDAATALYIQQHARIPDIQRKANKRQICRGGRQKNE